MNTFQWIMTGLAVMVVLADLAIAFAIARLYKILHKPGK